MLHQHSPHWPRLSCSLLLFYLVYFQRTFFFLQPIFESIGGELISLKRETPLTTSVLALKLQRKLRSTFKEVPKLKSSLKRLIRCNFNMKINRRPKICFIFNEKMIQPTNLVHFGPELTKHQYDSQKTFCCYQLNTTDHEQVSFQWSVFFKVMWYRKFKM